MPYRLGILSTHPIQYYSPWYRALAARAEIDLTVYYARRQSAEAQAAAGFGIGFEWDVPLLEGYPHQFLTEGSPTRDRAGFWAYNTPAIANEIRRRQFDAFLVHGWHKRCFWQAIVECWRTGTRLLVRGDSTLIAKRSRLKRLVKRVTHGSFIPRFDGYLVVGQRNRDYYLAYGADPRRMEFVPHCVDNDRFARAAAAARIGRAEQRAAWGIAADAVVFLLVAKLVPQKHPLDFIRALAIAARQAPASVGLVTGDGELRAQMEQEIKAARVPIQIAGFLNQSEIPRAYAMSDVLVLPSDGETWGLVVNEAMACGLPALVSDRVGCAPDLVFNDQTGYSFPFGNVEQLAELMVRLSQDAALRAKLGAAARDRVALYSIEAATEATCRAVARFARRASAARSSSLFRSRA